MGVNNKQRRAAKRRKRQRGGPRPTVPGFAGAWGNGFDPWSADHDPTVATDLLLQALVVVEADPGLAGEQARLLTSRPLSVPPAVVGAVARCLLVDVVEAVVQGGWTPADLAQVVRRRLTPAHLPCLAALLEAEEQRHAPDRVSPAWRDERIAIGPAAPGDAATVAGLAYVLGLTAVLGRLPAITTVLPPPGSRPTAAPTTVADPASKQLARVRALLAKAESTDFDEEAEALSAKAQELVSRYALDELLMHQRGREHPRDEVAIVARRIWLDAPYVSAKGLLVQSVAQANRCSVVTAERLGFSTVIGAASDGEWVELLATSLLVQADRAMLRHGRHVDRGGTSRTRSFRQSFLVAYALRIGERLSSAAAQATAASGAGAQLVPVLHERDQRVDQARRRMFPHVVDVRTSVNNGYGWAAGRAAADLALLDADLRPIPQSA